VVLYSLPEDVSPSEKNTCKSVSNKRFGASQRDNLGSNGALNWKAWLRNQAFNMGNVRLNS